MLKHKAIKFKNEKHLEAELNKKLFLFKEIQSFKVIEMVDEFSGIEIVLYPKEKSGLGVNFETTYRIDDIINYEGVDIDFKPCYLFPSDKLFELLSKAFGFEGELTMLANNEEILFLQTSEGTMDEDVYGLLEMLINISYSDPDETLRTAMEISKVLGFTNLVDELEGRL